LFAMPKMSRSQVDSLFLSLGRQGVLENQPFLSLWISQALTQLSAAFLSFSLFIWVFEVTGSNSAVSLIVLSAFVSSMVFSILGGVLADQVSRRMVMLASNWLRALSIGLFLIVPARLWWIVGLSFLVNSVSHFYIPAEAASIPMLVKKKDLFAANSVLALTLYLTFIGGFVLAGPIIRIFGLKSVFMIALVLTLGSMAFLSRLPPCLPKRKSKHFRFDLAFLSQLVWRQIKDSWRFVLANRYILTTFFILVALNGLLGLISSLAPGFVVEVLQIPATSASLVLIAPLGAGLLGGALLVGKFGSLVPKRHLIAYGMIFGGSIFFLMGFLPVVSTLSVYNTLTVAYMPRPVEHIVSLSGVMSALSFFLGLAGTMVVIPSQTVLQEHTTDEVRGRVFGVFGALVYGVSSLPTVVGARLADWFGVTTMIMFLGLVIVVAGLVSYRTRLVYRSLGEL
jgi:MFS family permease